MENDREDFEDGCSDECQMAYEEKSDPSEREPIPVILASEQVYTNVKGLELWLKELIPMGSESSGSNYFRVKDMESGAVYMISRVE